MDNDLRTKIQTEAATLLLLLVGLALPVLALLWGRVPGLRAPRGTGQRGPGADAAGERADGASLPARPVELSPQDKDYLMRLFLTSVEALRAGKGLPSTDDAPTACRRATGAILFVTVFTAGRRPVRVQAPPGQLAESVQHAAQRMVGRADFKGRELGVQGASRVRMDIVTESRLLTVDQKRAFVSLELDEPLGAALAAEGTDRLNWFLPADHASRKALSHREILETLCAESGQRADYWTGSASRAYRIKALSFVNITPGSFRCIDTPRGLPVVQRATLSDLVRSCELGADHLLRLQARNGFFAARYDAAKNAFSEDVGISAQFEAVSALARLHKLRPKDERIAACRRTLDAACGLLGLEGGSVAGAETDPSREPGVGARLSAVALRALCEYRSAGGDRRRDGLIAKLADSLVVIQGQEVALARRLARLKGDLDVAALDPDRQAKIALALILACRELGRQRYSAAGRETLELIAEAREELDLGSHPWVAIAAGEMVAPVRVSALADKLREGGRRLIASQLLEADVRAPDLIGAIVPPYPPPLERVATRLSALTACWTMDRGDHGNGGGRRSDDGLSASFPAAAERAARYLMQFQFVPENSYYLPDPERASGGIRIAPGSNTSELGAVAAAMDALAGLVRIKLLTDGNQQ